MVGENANMDSSKVSRGQNSLEVTKENSFYSFCLRYNNARRRATFINAC